MKYFRESGDDFHIAAAGSLLGVRLKHSHSFPVGQVDFMDLHPMSYMEFLSAMGRNGLRQALEQATPWQPLSELFHDQALDFLKQYFLVGGMPEAVLSYSKSPDTTDVRTIHKNILRSYELDFAKHAPAHDILKISASPRAAKQSAKPKKRRIDREYSVVYDRGVEAVGRTIHNL